MKPSTVTFNSGLFRGFFLLFVLSFFLRINFFSACTFCKRLFIYALIIFLLFLKQNCLFYVQFSSSTHNYKSGFMKIKSLATSQDHPEIHPCDNLLKPGMRNGEKPWQKSHDLEKADM